MGAPVKLALPWVTFKEDPTLALAPPSFDTLSEASVICRVSSEPNFKLAAGCSAGIEIEWPGEVVSRCEGLKVAPGLEAFPEAKIDVDECLLVWEEGRLSVTSAAGWPTAVLSSGDDWFGFVIFVVEFAA